MFGVCLLTEPHVLCQALYMKTPGRWTLNRFLKIIGCRGQKPLNGQSFFLKIILIYLFILEREEGREKDRKGNINVWLPLALPLLGTWPATQACALTRNWTSDPFFGLQPTLSPLSYTSQGPVNCSLFQLVYPLLLTGSFYAAEVLTKFLEHP